MPNIDALNLTREIFDVENTFKNSELNNNTPLQGELSTSYLNEEDEFFEDTTSIPEFINKLLPSPVNGKIMSVFVKPGSKVTEKDLIVIIESMKMKTSIYPKHSGIIRSVEVNTGNVVEQGDVLVIFK
jgi:biotin carboxyl carrier protein